MKKLAYFKIQENMTPRDASQILSIAKKSGYNDVIVLHGECADITKANYKEKLLSVLRGAYRHGVGIYIADDNYFCSGTGFGQLCSVKDLWQKVLVIKKKSAITEEDELLCEKGEECVVAVFPEKTEKCPFGHYPDLTNPLCAEMIIETIYKPLLNEYKKFSGYELKGFFCNRPVYKLEDNAQIPYCKDATERFKGDLFDVLEKSTAEYMTFVEESLEKNFILPLKRYCDEHNSEFITALGENSISPSFCKGENIIFLDPSMSEGNYCLGIKYAYDALLAYEKKAEPVVEITPGMGRVKNIGKIFEEYPKTELCNVKDFMDFKAECHVLTNPSNECITLGLLLEGEWCVYDWEKDEFYDFDKRADYTFYPKSFLCLVKKTEFMYVDKLPVRVGGVITWDFEEADEISFEKRENKIAFYLPDTPLSDKAVMITGKAECIKAKLGSMEHELCEDPFIIPLFDFQRDAGCLIEADGGEIDNITVIAKKKS